MSERREANKKLVNECSDVLCRVSGALVLAIVLGKLSRPHLEATVRALRAVADRLQTLL